MYWRFGLWKARLSAAKRPNWFERWAELMEVASVYLSSIIKKCEWVAGQLVGLVACSLHRRLCTLWYRWFCRINWFLSNELSDPALIDYLDARVKSNDRDPECGIWASDFIFSRWRDVIKSTVDQERAGMEYFSVVQFKMRMAAGYCRCTLM